MAICFGSDLACTQLQRVSEGHGVSPLTTRQLQRWRILTELESGAAVSQRALARKLGIALGLTNQLVRELAQLRFINCSHRRASGGAIEYRLTRTGRTHKAAVLRARMRTIVAAYDEARGHIQERLTELAASWKSDGAERRVVFYDDGTRLSELGWLCLQGTGLRLVGVVGDSPRFIGDVRVEPCERLSGCELAGERFDRLVVMSFGPTAPIRTQLNRCRVPSGVPFWI